MSVPARNRETVARLYEVHGRSLLAYACTFAPDLAAAEDVVHGVFLRLLSGKVTLPDSPLPYLFKAVRNTALNERRRQTREVALSHAAGWLEAPAGLEDDAIALETALGTLPLEQREVVVLRIWGQLSFEEVGVVIGCSINTAASRFRYGCQKLRAVLRPLTKETADGRPAG